MSVFFNCTSTFSREIKGGLYVADDCRYNDNSVGPGPNQQLHDGRFHSFALGHCYCCCAAQCHSGEASRVVCGKNSYANRLIAEKSEMKTDTLVAIILIVMGIKALAYQGITYTTREKILDLGPISDDG